MKNKSKKNIYREALVTKTFKTNNEFNFNDPAMQPEDIVE